MRTRRRATIEDLRLTIDCLPRQTRIAMLNGIAGNQIIAGAYTTPDGICPMLAAHRAGGRTSLIAFAKAWDRFAFRDSRSRRARRATERELLILRSHLEASLLAEDAPVGDLAAARSDHQALVARRNRELDRHQDSERDSAVRSARPQAPAQPRHERGRRAGDPDRSRELRDRPGWSWTRIVRRYDEYERVLRRLEAERTAAEPARTPAPPARTAAELERTPG